MKEICLINKGDNIEKLIYTFNLKDGFKFSSDRVLDKEYIILQDGINDITIVRNYNPYFIKKLSNSESMLDIYSQGYEAVAGCNTNNSNEVLIRKMSGVRYVVGPLEKLEDICKKFALTPDDIMKSNNLSTSKLFVGQILII